jgi:hypothetical protein
VLGDGGSSSSSSDNKGGSVNVRSPARLDEIDVEYALAVYNAEVATQIFDRTILNDCIVLTLVEYGVVFF